MLCRSTIFPSAVSLFLFSVLVEPAVARAQNDSAEVAQLRDQVRQLTGLVVTLESRVDALERREGVERAVEHALPEGTARLEHAVAELRGPRSVGGASADGDAILAGAQAPAAPVPAVLPGGATLNYYFDGYFENNFNNPTGRVNDLRAYDVLSRVFSINQADLVYDLDPDVQAGRRYGARLDLQFGQATETLQGNPANEPRPEIYRNIFQAYGTYVVPVGKGLNVDLGKWASSLGIEGNYAKDQMNYTRSFFFYFLPFYHLGARVHYGFNDKLGVNYWIVNGTNQSEPTNGYKDEMFGLALQPAKSLSWTVNYYLGQEHPDAAMASNCTVPVQPGLCFVPITPAPNGKLHIFDNYLTWTATPKLTLAAEGDYVIQRLWTNAAPGESAAPMTNYGGAAYAQYQFSPKYSLAARTEYLADPDGTFSNASQDLKEITGTWRYNVADNLALFLEYRRDWSNRDYFVTDNPAAPVNHQDTAGAGVVWWYGGKQGAW